MEKPSRMADFLTALRDHPLLADGAMGSYLFTLTGRLSETNHVYEAFNVEQPELIQKVHLAYLAAGARCLKTNTFGANRQQLRPFGLEGRVAALNRAGVQLARGAIAAYQAQARAPGPFFVLASVGPTASPLAAAEAVAECYREQLETLAAAGADALLLETFSSLPQLELLVGLIKSLPGMPPVIAEMTIRGASAGQPLEPDPVTFVNRVAALGVAVAGVNCCAPWDADVFVDAVRDTAPVRSGALQLVVMPNAGGFQRIGNRLMTAVNPEFAGKMARSLSDRGVRLVGGCCEMHPPHIQEMHNYLQSRSAGERVATVAVASTLPPAGDAEKRRNGTLSRKLKDGKFVVSIEALPPRGTDDSVISRKVEALAGLAASGLIDAVDFTDGSRGIPLISPGDYIHLLRERLGWTAATGRRGGTHPALHGPRPERHGRAEPAGRLSRQPRPQRALRHGRPAEDVADLPAVHGGVRPGFHRDDPADAYLPERRGGLRRRAAREAGRPAHAFHDRRRRRAGGAGHAA